MRFDPELAAIRFGCGLSPSIANPASAEEMLARLAGPDRAAQDFPIPGYEVAVGHRRNVRSARRAFKAATDEADREALRREMRQARRDAFREGLGWLGQTLLRRALTADGFRERLVAFWADHFTAAGRGGVMRPAHATFAEEAIRPDVAGRFSDLLRAAETHPLMLSYLDQRLSTGPNSPRAQRRDRQAGLNENLAREMLELHTLGVGGPYTQADVRQLAELLTGLSFTRRGMRFRPAMAEPGAETVLGRDYGGGKPGLEDIFALFDDLARHPATAAHVARKLAVHFVSDQPDAGLVADMAARFRETGGNLMEVYAVMLAHPAAWTPDTGNVKQPMDFVGSALRALDIVPRHVDADNLRRMRILFLGPLELMGQSWGRPGGPDGWPEGDADWITPQRLAARLQWGMTAPFRLRRVLPDPRDFVGAALGGRASDAVRFAASAAETRAEGVGLVLASPEFQRM